MSYNVFFSSPKKLKKEKKSGRSRTTELPSTQLAGWPWHTFFKYKGGSYLKIYEKFSKALSRNHKKNIPYVSSQWLSIVLPLIIVKITTRNTIKIWELESGQVVLCICSFCLLENGWRSPCPQPKFGYLKTSKILKFCKSNSSTTN